MPGVRYGPDISDDAAFYVDRVREIQAQIRRGAKIETRDKTLLRNARNFAEAAFGVSGDDFDRGRFGEMGEMARYGGSRDRSRRALSWRTGDSMKKSVAQEMNDRAAGNNNRGSVRRPQSGTFYEGRTRSKKFRQLEANAQQRLNKNGYVVGKIKITPGSLTPQNFKAQTDRFNITKTRADSSDLLNRPRGSGQTGMPRAQKKGGGPAGFTIRPPLAKSQQRAAQRAKKTDTGGTKKTRATSASSKRAKPQQAKRAKAVKTAGKAKKR